MRIKYSTRFTYELDGKQKYATSEFEELEPLNGRTTSDIYEIGVRR